MRIELVMVGALLTGALLCGAPQMVHAQDAGGYSVEAYAALQAEANAAFESLQSAETESDTWIEEAQHALALRLGLVSYLGEWMRSGTMPEDMVANAQETRAYLYQNIVAIYADIGQCASASRTTDQLSELLDGLALGTIGEELLLESNAAVSRCELTVSSSRSGDEEADAEVEEYPDEGRDAEVEGDDGSAAGNGPSGVALSSVPTDTPSTHPRWALVGLGGALGLGAVLYDGSVATRQDRDNRATCADNATSSECDLEGAHDTNDRIAASAPITLSLTVASVALVTTGILWRHRPPGDVSASAGVRFAITPWGVSLSSSF